MEPLSSGRGRWIGYVAMSTDEMTWRLGRCESVRLNPCDLHPNVKVDSWFLSLYTSAVGASRADPSSAATGGLFGRPERRVSSCGRRCTEESAAKWWYRVVVLKISGGGGKVGLVALDVALTFPQATMAS
uniref:Uncharacterized protein n=1 Tax=Oryza nivara TaxID=4536 RepID=A0A0E0IBE0_ORYNI